MKGRQTIYYWDGIFDINNLMTSEYNAVMQKLFHGEYAELNLEKLRGYNVYSIRVNRSDRVLFSTVTVNGRPYLIILDIVKNHDYEKSKFLKKNVLREYIDSINAENLEEIVESHFESCPEFKSDLVNKGEGDFLPVKRFGRKYIEFDQDQQLACNAALPLVIRGAAGSGKSCAVFQMVVDYATKNISVLSHPVLYVAASSNLCNTMLHQWNSLPIASVDTKKLIQFKTYADVIHELDPTLKAMQEVGHEEFYTFIKSRTNHKRQQNKAKQEKVSLEAFQQDKALLYQECRIICGCDSWEEYEKLGEFQAILKDKAQRRWLYDEYQEYSKYLSVQGKYDLAFYEPSIRSHCELVVVDETPDLSRLQVKVLRNLSLNPEDKSEQPQIVYCEDPRQNLYNNIDMHTYFGLLLNAKEGRVSFVNLNASHRCPTSVIKMADSITELGAKLSGLRPPTCSKIIDQENEGMVTWLTSISDEMLDAFVEDAQTAQFAVITLAEYKDQAQTLFKTELVFTVEEIKGLEYSKVVMYRLMDAPIYFAANKHLVNLQNNGSKSERLDQYAPAFNLLYTACTRATESLFIIQDNKSTYHKLKDIIACLNRKKPQEQLKQHHAPKVVNRDSDWLEEAKNQLFAGNLKKAEEICVNRLKMQITEFEKFKVMYLGEPKPVTQLLPHIIKKAKSKKNSNRSIIKPLAEEDNPEYYRDLLRDINSTRLQMIFKDEKAHIKLFRELPQFNNECIFALYCEYPEMRADIFNLHFINEFPKLVNYITPSAMMRKNRDALSPPPVYWLVTNEYAMNSLMQYPQFDQFFLGIFKDNLDMLNSHRRSFSPILRTSIIYWLSTTQGGRRVLTLLLNQNRDFFSNLSMKIMFNPYNGRFDSPTSIFDNLFHSNDGLELLILLLELNPSLMNAVTMQQLFYNPYPFADGRCSRMDELLQDTGKFGLSFLKRLQAGNPRLYKSDLTALFPMFTDSTSQFVRNFDYSHSMLVLKELEDNFTKENIDEFMTKDVASFLLFKVPYRNKQCFFTTMFNDPVKRKLILGHLYPAYHRLLTVDLNVAALCGNSSQNIPPLFWMCVDEQHIIDLYYWLFDNQNICEHMPAALAYQVDIKSYTQLADNFNVFKAENILARPLINPNTKLSAFLLLTLSQRGLDTLIFFADKIKYNTCIDEMGLYSVSLLHNGSKVSLFTYLCNSGIKGIQLLTILLKKNQFLAKMLYSDMLCVNATDLQNCPLINICCFEPGIDLLIYILNTSNNFGNSMTAKMIMSVFTKGVTDSSPIVPVLIAMFYKENGAEAMHNLLLSNCHLVPSFDRAFFVNKIDPKSNPNKAKLLQVMNSTKGGQDFINNVLRILSVSNAGSSSAAFFSNPQSNATVNKKHLSKP